jgi:chromosome partitioning protein
MATPTLAFFSVKGGVGRTFLTYHIAWSVSDLGKKILVIDLDPQANITFNFSKDSFLDQGDTNKQQESIYSRLKFFLENGAPSNSQTTRISQNIELIPGDLRLLDFESIFSSAWINALPPAHDSQDLSILSAVWQIAQAAAEACKADLVLIDMAPSLGAINRTALLACSHLVIPLTADFMSMLGLGILGESLQDLRNGWRLRREHGLTVSPLLPVGDPKALGYVLMRHLSNQYRRGPTDQKWEERLLTAYSGLFPSATGLDEDATTEPACIAEVRHYVSLARMALEARKPIFHLSAADGVIGSHALAVSEARATFKALSEEILRRIAHVERAGEA